jgi:hypothetical protein
METLDQENASFRAPSNVRRLRIGALIAAAVAIAFIVWLIVKDDGNSSPKAPQRATPVSASPRDLRTLARSVGHAVYWMGRRAGYTYELTQTSDGKIYVRYLPPGVPLGDNHPNYTTIGTYPYPNALAALRRTAREQGAATFDLSGGGLAVSRRTHRTSVYFAYPGENLLLETFDPSPAHARQLVSSGRVRPIR